MALSTATVVEVRAGGSDTNGGGFVTGASGTDWSQQNAAQYAVADGVTNGTTTITSATANFGTDVVGNLIYVAGGTGSVAANWYQITARTNATTITVDRSTGLTAGTGVTLNIGGAVQTPGTAGLISTQSSGGFTVFHKYDASPSLITTASTNVSGGCPSLANNNRYVGYDATRTVNNTDANRPTLKIDTGVSTATIFAGSANIRVANLILDGNSQTSSRGISANAAAHNVHFTNFTNGGHAGVGAAKATFCTATTNSSVSPLNVNSFYCEAYANTVTGFGSSASCVGCLSYNNSGASSDGFTGASFYAGCVAYGNGRHGFNGGTSFSVFCVNCVAESNSGFGYSQTSNNLLLRNCASYNNTSGRVTSPAANPVIDTGAITGSGSFFTNAAGNDFSPNNTASAGALLRAAAFPPAFPAGTTASYADVGAAQHQQTSSAGVVRPYKINGRYVAS